MDHFLSKDMIAAFLPNPNLRRLYITSQIVRTVLSKIVAFYTLAYIKLFKEFKSNSEVKVGIIGLGHMGSTILQELISLHVIPLENILVSTRSPERHNEYIESGVSVFWDNEKLATECDFIILSCLPHQMESVGGNIRGPLSNKSEGIFSFTEHERTPSTLIFSVLSGTPQAKLVQMIDNYPFLLRTFLNVDMINLAIDQTADEEVPLKNCIELLHEILVTSVDCDEICKVFSLVFTGKAECEEVKKYFLDDKASYSEKAKEVMLEYKIIDESS